MSTIKLNELAESDINLSDLIAKSDTNGLMTKTNIEKLANYIGAIGSSGMKAAIESTSPAPTEDGLYPCTESGTYTNFGGEVVDISGQLVFISVSSTQTVFDKVVIPLGFTFDNEPTDGSTNAVESGGIYKSTQSLGEKLSNTKIWLDKSNGATYTTSQKNVIDAVKDVKVIDAEKEEYSIKTIVKNNTSYGNRIILKGDSTEYLFDNPNQMDGTSFNDNALNKLLLDIGTSKIYIEIDYGNFSDGIIINGDVLDISKSTFLKNGFFNIQDSQKLVQINKLGDNKVSIEDGATRKKVVFPNSDTGYFCYDGGYFKFPRNVDYEFSSNFKVFCVDLDNLPSSNELPISLVEKTAYYDLDLKRYVPVVSRWNSDDNIYIYPRFKPFFADSNTSGLNVLAFGDSIWDANAYSSNGLVQASNSLGFALNNCAIAGASFSTNFILLTSSNVISSTGSKTVTDVGGNFATDLEIGYTLYANNSVNDFIGVVESIESDTSLTLVNNAQYSNSGLCRKTYTTDNPTANSRSANFENQVRLAFKRINVDQTYNTPDLILIALGTNFITFDEDYPSTLDNVMATPTYETMASNLLKTTQGAFRNGVEQLMNEFPNAQIIVFTPRQTAEDLSTNGRTYARLQTRAEKIIEISNRYSIEVVNYLTDLQICGVFENVNANGRFLSDGLHPNTDGRKLEKDFLVNVLGNKIIKK